MRNIILCLAMTLACVGCGASLPEVAFEYFNLSANEIWLTDITGLPPNAAPGRLIPGKEEIPLEVKASVFSERVRMKDRITIKWKDNGKEGWPGGLKIPGSIPPGVAHQAEFKRDDFGIPAKLSSGKIRFTYLGNEKWLVKFLK